MIKILVRAPALSLSGYGIQSQFALKALREHEDKFDIYVDNIPWGQTGQISEQTDYHKWVVGLLAKTERYIAQKGTFDMSLQITIPNEFDNKFAPVNVGFTAGIETNRVSPAWIERSQMVDRIIVVSNHSKEVFEKTSYQVRDNASGQVFNVKCQAPITTVNYPVRNFEPDPEFTKELDDLLTTEFNFLSISQWGPRKNVSNTVKWFVEEFYDQDVGLILKTFKRNNSTRDRLYTENEIESLLNMPEYKDRKCKIHFLHGDLSDSQMTSLYQHERVKSLISLSNGEGFCLPLFEAAYNEVPVITTAYSGQCDYLFMPIKNKKKNKIKNRAMFAKVSYDMKPIQPEVVWNGVLEKDSMWAFPHQGSYKMKLRDVYKNYHRFKSQAKKLAKYIETNFTQEKKYQEMIDAILGQKTQSVSVPISDLPTISLYCSVFDGAEYIESYLKNITEQTIFDKKIELILIHPKTSPTFKEEKRIIDKFNKIHNNIIYKVLEKDPGTYACWNIGAKHATGDLLGNANLDDRMSKDAVEKKAKELFLNPDIDLVYGDMLITDQPCETFEKNSSNGRRYKFPEFSYEALKVINMPHAAPLYRAELHEKFGYFDESFKSAADWEFHLRCAQGGAQQKKMSEIVGLYYFSPKGISTNPENDSWKREEENKVVEKYFDSSVKKIKNVSLD